MSPDHRLWRRNSKDTPNELQPPAYIHSIKMDHSREYKRRRLDNGHPRAPERRPQQHNGRGRDQRNVPRADQARINELQEAERHREFMAKEGQFVLQQKRKAAEIRVKEGRAKPVDFLAVNLEFFDPLEDLINDDGGEKNSEYTEPAVITKALSSAQIGDLMQEIDGYLEYTAKPKIRDYWATMKVLCLHQKVINTDGKAVRAVSGDIDKLLRPKSYDELIKLERQVHSKIDSDEPIDTDYWQQLLQSLVYYKALAKIERLRSSVLESKASKIRSEQAKVARKAQSELSKTQPPPLHHSKTYDPVSSLQIQPQHKSFAVIDEASYLSQIAEDRNKVLQAGPTAFSFDSKQQPGSSRNISNTDQKASKLYHEEAAKGVEDDEEVFAGEEDVAAKTAAVNDGYHSRKPRYFNRVQMGYEWNKYNQTHYDQENPPPKVVQGYKFHIFYPDLIDTSKAPTYKITREDGRKRGETMAPAGEEDTCIIRFMSGPPYEDVAFRIVDREWDYSTKHERGFQSTFENGILTLHFTFKKIYYRK